MQLRALDTDAARYLVPTYTRADVVFTHGEGVYLYDLNGKRYLDFTAGIAVNALGHRHPDVLKALVEQAEKLIHVSNLYHSPPQFELARRLVEHSFADRIFYSNSGSEANETALKFARKWGRGIGGAEKTEIVAFDGAFHGRTSGSLSITYKHAYRAPFEPLLSGVSFARFNDLASADDLITENTCAVFVEPVQGEGGIRPASSEFLSGLRALCSDRNALLVFDEVQCGLGRTGALWAHAHHGVTPDIMTLAKPLACGLPIGVTLVTEQIAAIIEPGDHGSTFGGGPLICHVAKTVFDRINQTELFESVAVHGDELRQRLSALPSATIRDVRGLGLLIGVEFDRPVAPLMKAALEQGLIVINAGENVLRLCPPLIIGSPEIEAAVSILKACLERLEKGE